MSTKFIVCEMREDHARSSLYDAIPYVVYSTHPDYVKGTRFDWGFLSLSLLDGYTVHIMSHKNWRKT